MLSDLLVDDQHFEDGSLAEVAGALADRAVLDLVLYLHLADGAMDVVGDTRGQIQLGLLFRTDRLAAVGAQFAEQSLIEDGAEWFDRILHVADELDPFPNG